MRDLSDFGLKGRLPHFIDNFLSNRNFKVRVGTILSDLQGQEEGVPQGSILSVTLFSIKINNFVKALSLGVDCSLYVDDFLICHRSKHMHTIERQLQQCLNKIQKWALENGFKFSKTKTQCMHFCQLRGLHNDPVLMLDGDGVVDQYKFLGVIFDRKLSFIPHINYLKAKCHKALQFLRVVAHTDWGGGGLINLLYLNYINCWFDLNWIMVVLYMGQAGSLIFAVLTPFITWVYDLHLVHCELLPSRVSMLRLMRLH